MMSLESPEPHGEVTLGLARKQHFIPRFLLRRFCGGKKRQLWVFDKTTGRTFRTNPANVAAARDLYSIELGDYVASVEPSLAKLESKWAAILNDILRADSILDLSVVDRVHLGVLIAHLHLRSPRIWRDGSISRSEFPPPGPPLEMRLRRQRRRPPPDVRCRPLLAFEWGCRNTGSSLQRITPDLIFQNPTSCPLRQTLGE